MGDLIFIFLIYFINIFFINGFAKPRTNTQGLKLIMLLFHYHILFGFYYGWFAYGTDTNFYWNLGDKFRVFNFESWSDSYGTHNYFVFFINYPFSKVMGLNFWTGTFLYANISVWAFILIYFSGRDILKSSKVRVAGIPIWPFILFLPSLHFWSSGIGKDSLIFLFLAMFFYGLRDLRKYVILVMISAILLYHVRPHIAFIVLISASIMLFLDSNLHITYKLIFFSLAILGYLLIYEEVLKFLKIEELDYDNIEGLFSSVSVNLSYGKSYVDMSNYPYLLKVFTFLYRPLFFDAHNFSSFLNSIENFICLTLTIIIFSKINPLKGYKNSSSPVKIMLLTFIITSFAFSGALSNFGIMVRMKNMTFIYFLLFLIVLYDDYLYKKYIDLLKLKKRRVRIK